MPTVGPARPHESTSMTDTPDRIQRIRVFLLLVAFAAGVYMLTYRAAIQSGDTRRALDAVTSTVRYGDWLMDETHWIKLPFRIRASDALPLVEYRVQEQLNILLAGPLLRIADALPRLGNIHTIWLFNVFITSLNVGLVYLILRAMSLQRCGRCRRRGWRRNQHKFLGIQPDVFPRAGDGLLSFAGAAGFAMGSGKERRRPHRQPGCRRHWDAARLSDQVFSSFRPARDRHIRPARLATWPLSHTARRPSRAACIAAGRPMLPDAG